MVIRRITLTIGICLTAFGLLIGCTRNRATPTPVPGDTGSAITVITSTQAGGEPLVTIASAITAPAAIEGTPTPTELTQTTIDYYVKDGDTIASVAEKFEVTVERVRQLNFLQDDNIYVGQILQMPYSEGITAEGAPTPTPEPYRYTVEAGDSLGTIAQQFGVSGVSIMEANELQDPNSVYVGQSLVIPNYAPPNSATTNEEQTTPDSAGESESTNSEQAGGEAVSHIVQPGETLYGIAQKYGVDANIVAEANNIANPNQLRVGQKISIPGITTREAAAALGRVHVIQSGESLSAIAQQYGVTAEEIITFNNISNPDAIYVGQELIIPGQ
jgi:LysM repeat protein